MVYPRIASDACCGYRVFVRGLVGSLPPTGGLIRPCVFGREHSTAAQGQCQVQAK